MAKKWNPAATFSSLQSFVQKNVEGSSGDLASVFRADLA
jgi:hypothetical protein